MNFYLEQNFPNPFNPITNIAYEIKEYSSVYNLIGEEIADLLNEKKEPGKYEVVFSGDDLANGIYFYKLQANDFADVKAMTILK